MTDIFEYIVYEMIEIPEELLGDEDWVEEYKADEWARYAYEQSDFDTEGEYQEYLIRHEAIKRGQYVSLNNMREYDVPTAKATRLLTSTPTQIPTPTPTPTVTPIDVPAKTNAPIVLTDVQKEYTIINADGKAVQTFCKNGNYMYLSQRVDGDVVITKTMINTVKSVTEEDAKKWNIKAGDSVIDLGSSSNKQMILSGYNHGQSLEMFKYGGKVYLMISAGEAGDFGNAVAFIQFKNNAYTYGSIDDEYNIKAKTLTKVGYANTKRKDNGVPRQVEVALSEDKKTMLVWCQLKTDDTAKRKVQVSCYNLKSVMKQFKAVETKAKKYNKKQNKKHSNKKMRIRKQFNQLKKSTCYCSALQTDDAKNVIKPYGSIQGIDLENKKNGEYTVYICGGNDHVGMQPAIATMSLSTGGKTTYLAKTDIEPIHTADATMFGTDQMEMEGIHYAKDKLEMIFAPANDNDSDVSKDRQVLFTIDSSAVK